MKRPLSALALGLSIAVSPALIHSAQARPGFMRGMLVGGAGGALAVHLWDQYHNHKQSLAATPAGGPCPSNPWTNNPCPKPTGETTSTGTPLHRSPEGYTSGSNGGSGWSKERSIIVPAGTALNAAPKNWNSQSDETDQTYGNWTPNYATNHGQVKVASVNISQLHNNREINGSNGPNPRDAKTVARWMLAQAYQSGNYQPPVWLTEEERQGIRNGDAKIPGLIWRERTEYIYELWTN